MKSWYFTWHFKEKDGTIHKLTCDYEMYPDNPRKFGSQLGYMVFKDRNNYSLGDQQVEDYKDFFLSNLPDGDREKCEQMSERQLFELWEKEQFLVLPLNFNQYSSSMCRIQSGLLSINEEQWLDGTVIEDITNDGFIFVSKDNQELSDYLEKYSEEEVKQMIEKIFEAEISEYSHYVNGEVYYIKDEIFNKSTLCWDEVEKYTSIYEDPYAFVKAEFGEQQFIPLEEILQLENTITPEYVEATGKKFFDEIGQCLADFDGNLWYAQKAVFNAWSREGSNDLFPNKSKLTALGQFLKDNGCTTEENTIHFLEKNIEPYQAKEFDPFSQEAEHYETFLLPNWNSQSSNFKSRMSPDHALIVDRENRRFGILSKAYSFDGSNLPNYKKNALMTRKKFIEKIKDLQSYGLHFEKFTGEYASYSQGKVEDFISRKDKKKTRNENGRER